MLRSRSFSFAYLRRGSGPGLKFMEHILIQKRAITGPIKCFPEYPLICTSFRCISSSVGDDMKWQRKKKAKKKKASEAFDIFKQKLTGKGDTINTQQSDIGNQNNEQNIWLKSPPELLQQETERLRKEISNSHKISKASPNPNDYLCLFEAWRNSAKTTGVSAAQQAESLLKSLEQAKPVPDNNDKSASIIPCYKYVLETYANCEDCNLDTAIRVQTILDEAMSRYREQVTTDMINNCLHVWAKTGDRNAGEKATAILKLCEESNHFTPNAATIQTTMQAWSKSSHPKAPENIMALLAKTIQQWQNQDRNAIAPNLGMIHTAMGAIAKSATHHHQRKLRKVAEQLEYLLDLLMEQQDHWKVKPNLRTYLIVLGAWERVERAEKRGEAAQHAEDILMKMIARADAEAIQKMRGSSSEKGERPFQVNSICFSSVMTAWAHANKAQRAEDLYHKLLNRYRSTRDKMLLPRSVEANCALAAWGNVGRPDRVLQLLSVIKQVAEETKHPDCQLDIRFVNILLNAFGKNGEAKEALSLLLWLENPAECSDEDRAKYAAVFPPAISRHLGLPDDVSYSTVLNALGKEKEGEKAVTLLDRMKRRNLKPNLITYTAVIYALAGTRYPDKVARAHRLLEEAINLYQPDLICLVAFMQVCAHAEDLEHELAFQLAMQAFGALERSARNDRCYKAMAQVLNHTVSDSSKRNQLLEELAVECCQAGWLSNTTLQELERRCKSELDSVVAWMKSSHIQPKWSRKVAPDQRPKGRRSRDHLLRKQK